MSRSPMLFTIATLTWTFSTVGPAVAGDAPFTRRLAVVATTISDDRLDIISTEDIAIQSDAAINAFGQINKLEEAEIIRFRAKESHLGS